MKNLHSYTIFLNIAALIAVLTLPISGAPETSAGIQVTEMPIGNRGAMQNGKLPFRLVPVDTPEGLPEEQVVTNPRRPAITDVRSTVITPERAVGGKLASSMGAEAKNRPPTIVRQNPEITAQNSPVSPSGQALPVQPSTAQTVAPMAPQDAEQAEATTAPQSPTTPISSQLLTKITKEPQEHAQTEEINPPNPAAIITTQTPTEQSAQKVAQPKTGTETVAVRALEGVATAGATPKPTEALGTLPRVTASDIKKAVETPAAAAAPTVPAIQAQPVTPVAAKTAPQNGAPAVPPSTVTPAPPAKPTSPSPTSAQPVETAAITDAANIPTAGTPPAPAPIEEKKGAVKQEPIKREKPHNLISHKKKKEPKSMADSSLSENEAWEQLGGIEQEKADDPGLTDTAEAFEKLTESGGIHLGSYLEPWKGFDPNEHVEMNFDNKELTELLRFLSNTFDVTFITDDSIEPLRAEGLQPMGGTKITFKSSVPLTLQQAWEIGLTFIEMAGFSVIPSTQPRTYRVTVSASRDKPSANREPLPTFIGSDPELIPNNDTKIRYVYFAENAELSTIIQIIEAMKSGSAGPLIEITPLRAVIMTDKAANIRSLVGILQEIDRVTMPETLAIIRLRHTDARQVRELYHKLIGKDPQSPMFNPFMRPRKSSTTQYFTEATRVFEEPYTNSLIVLGTRENIKRFEDFILKYVDKTLDIPFSPLHVIQLKYMDAASIAKILNDVIQKFNADPSNTQAALVGGVRDTNKFFRPSVRITEETSGNRLIINADYDEYLKIRELIEKLDVEQPQVAVKVLILDVDLTNTKQLGVQLRNKVDCCDGTGGLDTLFGRNVNWQTSMLGPIITQQPTPSGPSVNGAERLLGNLIQLANLSGNGVSPFGVGSTLVTLGQDLFGFWGLLRALENYTRISVVANPFLIVTNKYKAEFKVGETRRTTTAIVEGQREAQAQGDISADLRIIVTPQISFDDMVTLNIYVEIGQFIDTTTENRIIKRMSTEALLANREVLALGGLIRDNIIETTYRVPFFGSIPVVGWLFKNKTKAIERTSLLILICPEIIKPYEPEVAQNLTYSKIADVKDNLYKMRSPADRRDPIHRWFFGDNKDKEASYLDKFVSTQQRYIDESQRKTEVVAQRKQPATSPNKKGLLDLVPGTKGARA